MVTCTPNQGISGLASSCGASKETLYSGPRGSVRHSTGPWDHLVEITGETGRLISSISYKRGTAMGTRSAENLAKADLLAAVNGVKAGASHRLEPDRPRFWVY